MSGRIKIDTDRVSATANRISTINKQIDAEFERLETAIRRLNSSWNSRASENVIGRFYSIQNTFKDSRYRVMKDYCGFLQHQVSAGYNGAETSNTSLADAFK